ADTSHVQATSAIPSAESIGKARGCWWRDSNPQELSLRDVRDLCVYQFRHTSTSWLRTLAIPKAKTRGPTRAAARTSTMRIQWELERIKRAPKESVQREISLFFLFFTK